MVMWGSLAVGWTETWQGFGELPLFVQVVLLAWSAIVILAGGSFLLRVFRGAWRPPRLDRDQKSRRA